MSAATLAKYRAAIARAAETFESVAAEIEKGTRPLNDLLEPAKTIATVAEAAQRELSRAA